MAERYYPYMWGQAKMGLRCCLSDLLAAQECLVAKNYRGAQSFIELGIDHASRPINLNMTSDTEVEEIVPLGKVDPNGPK